LPNYQAPCCQIILRFFEITRVLLRFVAVRVAKKFSQWNVGLQSAFLWCENISAYAIGAVAMFWVIQPAKML